MAGRELQGLRSAARRQHGVAVGREHFPGVGADGVVVLDQQHRLGATRRFTGGGGCGQLLGRLVYPRQVDFDRGPPPRLRIQPDVAAALLHDAVHRREPEPRALALFLRGEERLEDPRLRGGVHADARVRDGEHYVGAGSHGPVLERVALVELGVCRFDRELAAPRHRVAGVHDQVHDHLLQLARVGPDGPQVGRQRGLERHVRPDQPAQHVVDACDHAVQVEHPRGEDLPAAEGEQLAGERRGPLRGAENLLDVVAARVFAREILPHQLRVPPDRGQHVVEVVSHPARQLPHCFHLLRLEQLHLERLAFGDVHWIHDEARLTRDSAGRPVEVFGSWVDITERKALEMQLLQAQKMEAVGQLAGGVAHDFNNVLTAIGGYAELLRDDLPGEDTRRHDVEEILRATERAATLTRQLLAFSRRQVLAPRVLDLNGVVAGIDNMLRRLIGADVALKTALAPDLGAVRADPGQLEQVIMNLIVNARDAMPRGGKLTIETANAELDQSYALEHRAVAPGPYVMLAVSDTGVGMDAATQARVFEPFFTTKEKGKGTGLGLATVYGIVKQSGGNIWLYSEPGRGTTFKIYLPRVDQAPEQLAAAPAVRETPRGTETVLLVEDDDAVRTLTRKMLAAHGYTVLAAGGGAEALELAAGHTGPIPLLVPDVR